MINENDKSNTESKPNFISKEEADKKVGSLKSDLEDKFKKYKLFIFFGFQLLVYYIRT